MGIIIGAVRVAGPGGKVEGEAGGQSDMYRSARGRGRGLQEWSEAL